MRLLVIILLLLSSAFGQQRSRKVYTPPADSGVSTSVNSGYRAERRQPGNAKQKAAASTAPQAAGVLQLNLNDASRIAWFVNTEFLPQGTLIKAYVILPDNQTLELKQINVGADGIPAGTSLALPWIRNLGDFWPAGPVTYDVLVKKPDGTNTHVAADYCANCARNYDNLLEVVPLIYAATEATATDKSVNITVDGYFTNDTPLVVLEDLVVPPSAISRDGSGRILINASKVPNAYLDLYQTFLLTVSQGGWSDTTSFTHVPFKPGTYVPSP